MPTPPPINTTDVPCVRHLSSADSLADLTAMLHRAYKPLADKGMRYLASHQDEQMTAKRITEDHAVCLVAVIEDAIVGTITVNPQGTNDGPAWFQKPGVATFQQFAVDPHFQNRGIGAALLNAAEHAAREAGATQIACDTSEHAHDLIAMYQRRGYTIVDEIDWDITNYKSVVLGRAL